MINTIRGLSDAKKSAMAFLFASFIQQAISFLVTPFFTRLLSMSDFGMVSVYNSWVEMINPIATLSLYSGLYNISLIDYEDRRSEITTSLLMLSNIATIIVMVLFSMSAFLFNDYIQLPGCLLALMTLYFLVYPATRFWMARERFEYKYKALTIATIVSGTLSPTVGLVCVLLAKSNLGFARLFGSNSIIIAFGIFFYVVILKRWRKINTSYWKHAIAFSVPLLPHYLAMHILAASDRVMVQYFYSSEAAAIYSIAYTASMVITIAWTAINGSLTPYVLEKLKEDKLEDIQKVTLPCLLLFSAFCLLVVFLAPEVILILGGARYAESINFIPPLTASVLFMGMYNIFSIVEFYHKKTKMIMVATIVAALLNIVLNAVCLPVWGYKAAAYTTLFCYIAYCLFHYINVRIIEKRKIYNPKILIIVSLVYVVLCLSALTIYKYVFIRYGILMFAIMSSVLFRKRLLTLYENMLKRG